MKKTMLIIMAVCDLMFFSQAKETDIIKPAIQTLEQGVQQFLNKLTRDNIMYEVKVIMKEDKQFLGTGSKIVFTHIVKIPFEIEQEFRKYDFGAWMGLTNKYKTNPKYSAYLAILNLSYHKNGYDLPQPLQAIINHKKREWDNSIDTKMDAVFLYHRFQYFIMNFYREILQHTIPSPYHKDVHFDKENFTSILNQKSNQVYSTELEWRVYLCFREIINEEDDDDEKHFI